MKILLIMMLFIVSCAQKVKKQLEIVPKTQGSKEIDSVIVGELKWFGADEVSKMKREVGNAVGLLKVRSNNTRCSAFMISHKIAMTNNHCIKNQAEAKGAIIQFGYDDARGSSLIAKCGTFIKGNRKLDYSLIECEQSPGKEVGVVTFSKRKTISAGEKIMITHYNCDYHSDNYCTPYKKFSFGKVINTQSSQLARNRHKVFYNADTLGGSSGSAVFYYNKKKQAYYLIGIHNKGYGDTNKDGRGLYNSGVIANDIRRDIERL